MPEKKTFVFYKGWAEAIKEMPDDIRLEVYDCIVEYAFSGKVPSLKPMAKIAFNFIKNDIDMATDKYNKKVEINRINGANGGRPKKTENQQITETQQNPKNPVGFSETQRNPHDNDNEHDNDNDIKTLPNGKSRFHDKIDFSKLIDFINKKTNRNFKTVGDAVKRKYNARLKDGYTKEDILNAVHNAVNNQYHKDNGFQYLTPEFFSRADTLEKYSSKIEFVKSTPKTIPGPWN